MRRHFKLASLVSKYIELHVLANASLIGFDIIFLFILHKVMFLMHVLFVWVNRVWLF